jgi:hypothetical protein
MEKILNLIYQLLNPGKERYALKYAKRPRLDKYYWQQNH